MGAPRERKSVLLVGPKAPPYGGVALQGRLLEEMLVREGVEVTFLASNIPFPKPLRFFEWIRGIRPFARGLVLSAKIWAALERADAVHVMACSYIYFWVTVAPAVILSRLRGKRVILNYRAGNGAQFFKTWGWLAAPIFKMSTVVSAPSNFLGEPMRQHFHVPVQIVPNIVDLSKFQFRMRPSIRPRIVITRHLEPIYDVQTAIRAFRQIQQQYPDASLRIAGTGSQESYLRGLVSSWNLANVQFLGHIPQHELPALYNQCDILLNSSRVDNFPGSLLEAAASGLAIVSTNPGGIPFLFEDGRNALLVRPGDSDALAAAVDRVVKDTVLAERLITNARTVAAQCEWVNIRRLLYETYDFASSEIQEPIEEGAYAGG